MTKPPMLSNRIKSLFLNLNVALTSQLCNVKEVTGSGKAGNFSVFNPKTIFFVQLDITLHFIIVKSFNSRNPFIDLYAHKSCYSFTFLPIFANYT